MRLNAPVAIQFKRSATWNTALVMQPPFLWGRLTLSLLLKAPLHDCHSLQQVTRATYKNIKSFKALSSNELHRLCWQIEKKATRKKTAYPKQLVSFVRQIIDVIRSLTEHLSLQDLYYTTSVIYKEITRHFFLLELLSPQQLYECLHREATFSKKTNDACHSFIQKAIDHLLCPQHMRQANVEQVSCYIRNYFRQLKSLPSISDFDASEWEELIWEVDMDRAITSLIPRNVFVEELLKELTLLLPDSSAHERAEYLEQIQERLNFTVNITEKEFAQLIQQTQLELYRIEKELHNMPNLIYVLQKYIKEVLRFSQNIDSAIHFVTLAYRETQRLPKVVLAEFKRTIHRCRQGSIEDASGKLTIYDPLKTFICRGLREQYENHPNISEHALIKELTKSYELALSLPPLPPDELERKVQAALYDYLLSHPLHNTLRPITLGDIPITALYGC